MTLGHQLRALDAMKSSRLWLIYKTPGRELRALDDINRFHDHISFGSPKGTYLIRAQLVSQLIRVQLVLLDRGSNQQNL